MAIGRLVWHWILPIIGILSIVGVGLLFALNVYLDRKIIKDPTKISEERILSPDKSVEAVTVRYESEFMNLLFGEGPTDNSYVYIVDTGEDISWEDDWYAFTFNDTIEDEGQLKGQLTPKWSGKIHLVFEYCNVSVSEFDNYVLTEGEQQIELSVIKGETCKAKPASPESDFSKLLITPAGLNDGEV